jgi:plastocyanin
MQPRFTTRALALAAAGILTFTAAACGDDDDDAIDVEETPTTEEAAGDGGTTSTAADAPAVDATVVAEDIEFQQVPASVAPGPHTLTADEGNAFDSGVVEGGGQGEVTAPAEPGDYAFHCEIHPGMTATLTVA